MDMYRVFIYEDTEGFGDSDFARACAALTEERVAKANSYVRAKDRNLSVIAGLLLRRALADAYSIRELPPMDCSRRGKPMLRGEGMPCFNISHCDLAVACAVSDDRVGIDAEPYSSYSEEVAREVLSDEELA